jgi:hypothetical protein
MLQLRETRIVNSMPNDVLTGHIVEEEGMALVYVKENGETKVRTSTGAAGELFAGVSFSRNTPPGVLPLFLEGVVSATNNFALPRNPIVGQILVKIDGDVATLVAGAPAAADEVQVGAMELIFNAGSAGKVITVQMLYAPSVIEARSIIGDAPIGGLPSSAQGSVGILKNAIIGTNMFDAAVDWSAALYVKTAAGGTFTVGTLADHIPNVIVKSSPNASNPFLVLSLNVA